MKIMPLACQIRIMVCYHSIRVCLLYYYYYYNNQATAWLIGIRGRHISSHCVIVGVLGCAEYACMGIYDNKWFNGIVINYPTGTSDGRRISLAADKSRLLLTEIRRPSEHPPVTVVCRRRLSSHKDGPLELHVSFAATVACWQWLIKSEMFSSVTWPTFLRVCFAELCGRGSGNRDCKRYPTDSYTIPLPGYIETIHSLAATAQVYLDVCEGRADVNVTDSRPRLRWWWMKVMELLLLFPIQIFCQHCQSNGLLITNRDCTVRRKLIYW